MNLGSTKDTKPTNENSGIYEIPCSTRNCGYKYIGQTRKSIKPRLKEYSSHTNNDHIDLSSVAHHMKIKLKSGWRLCIHNFDVTNLKLLKNVTNSRKLDTYESIFLFKNRKKHLMNDERQALGNIQLPLFKLLHRWTLVDCWILRVWWWLQAVAEINDGNKFNLVKSKRCFLIKNLLNCFESQ
jgi:hypothetical protein